MAILGMIDAEKVSTHRFQNWRRRVFYNYPQGSAPLTGILSMLKEEPTNDPVINWFEKRHVEQKTITAVNTTGPFTDTSNSDLASSGLTIAANTEIRVVVSATTEFRVTHAVEIRDVPINGGGTSSMFGVITSLGTNSSKKYMQIRVLAAIVITNTAASNGLEVIAIGTANAEGAADTSSGIWHEPISLSNYTQIFRTPYTISGTALKTAAKFDNRGVFPDQAKESAVHHMEELEKALFFGRKTLYTDGSGNTVRTMDGILQFLTAWEAGSTYGNTAATASTDDNKRIINNVGALSEATYDGYMERLFRVCNNKVREKICFCGSGFLNIINQMYKSKATLMTDLPMKDTYGMDVVKHVSPFGTVYYKTHPLFTQNANMRFNALYLDVNNLVYRPMQGRDTQLLMNRQTNDTDGIKNEWLTETTLEMRYPESHMYLKGITGYAP